MRKQQINLMDKALSGSMASKNYFNLLHNKKSKMRKQKYIRTVSDEIIIFPMEIDHSVFLNFNPITAGFCTIMPGKEKVICEGESVTLNISSKPKDDSKLATRQVFGPIAVLDM